MIFYFLIQMVDRLVVQSQDTINALSIDSLEPYSTDVETAKLLIKDADRSKMVSLTLSQTTKIWIDPI